jgi:hypothetical protein
MPPAAASSASPASAFARSIVRSDEDNMQAATVPFSSGGYSFFAISSSACESLEKPLQHVPRAANSIGSLP